MLRITNKVFSQCQLGVIIGLFLLSGSAYAVQCNGTNENTAITATTDHLADNIDGTITDSKTGLIWKKCNEGETWDANTNGCQGSAANFNWQQALQHAESVNSGTAGENFGATAWRLPNIKELASIVEQRCYSPSADIAVFPSTVSSLYWSSSPYAPVSNFAWVIGFGNGGGGVSSKGTSFFVRLVRSGQ